MKKTIKDLFYPFLWGFFVTTIIICTISGVKSCNAMKTNNLHGVCIDSVKTATLKVVDHLNETDSLVLSIIDKQGKKIDSLSTVINEMNGRLKKAEMNIKRIDLDLDAYD